jgi:hypothetical protein
VNDWTTNPDGTETRACRRQWCPHEVVKGSGRPPIYCSDACRQMDYRHRKETAARHAEAVARHDRAETALRQMLVMALNTYTGPKDLRRVSARALLVEHVVQTGMLHRTT